MIDSIKEIRTVKACDLPPTFDIRVGANEFAFELDGMDESFVYMLCTTTNEIVNIERDADITILVPDTWDNAKWDISLALMTEGML